MNDNEIIKALAIKEFADRLKSSFGDSLLGMSIKARINNLVKEMTEASEK